MCANLTPDGRLMVEITPGQNCEVLYYRIEALLGLLMAADQDALERGHLYEVCAMIRDLMPPADDFVKIAPRANQNLTGN